MPMMILSIIIAFFTNIIRSGIAVFFLSIFVLLAFKVWNFFLQYSGVFFTSMMDWYTLMDYGYYSVFQNFP